MDVYLHNIRVIMFIYIGKPINKLVSLYIYIYMYASTDMHVMKRVHTCTNARVHAWVICESV